MNLPVLFETLEPKILIGMRLSMSFADNQTARLWQSFMPRRSEIRNICGPELYSMQIYPKGLSPTAEFEKWAAAEVHEPVNIPEGMERFDLPGGLYAVFHYKGSSADAPKVFGHIFGTWLPASGCELDNRPHFEILGEKYRNNDPNSEEEIWIPVKRQRA